MLSQVNLAFVDMLDLLSGQDNVDGFKSVSHFVNINVTIPSRK